MIRLTLSNDLKERAIAWVEENGDLVVPNEPGLGITVDESVIERYPYQPGPWSIFKIDSPPETLAVSGDHSVLWVDPVSGA